MSEITSVVDNSRFSIENDRGLLEIMVDDVDRQPPLYKPGRFWIRQSLSAANEIRRHGIADFRGRNNGIGLSYADKVDHDIRHSLNFGARRLLKLAFERIYPFNRIMDGQVRLTLRITDEAIREKAAWLQESPRIRQLISDYRVPYSLGGGCTSYCELDGEKVSIYYLALLDTIANIHQHIDLREKRSYFEIGGGFGANVHLLLTNFPNIRKLVYLDIPPNLYVGTQYLRSHFPAAIKDYRDLRNAARIGFSDDDRLEILCIAPWQIEALDVSVDLFHNAHSFVEMPSDVVANYARHIERLLHPERGSIALASYDSTGVENTVQSDKLPGFFRHRFQRHLHSAATSPGLFYQYYTSAAN